MPANSTSHPTPRGITRLDLLSIAALIGILYFAQDFFVPLVLAALLSFLLDPLNRWLERRGFKHLLAVLTTTLLSFCVIGVLIYVVTTQILDLAEKLPDYRNNLIEKAESLRMSEEGPIGRAVKTIKEVAETIEKDEPPAAEEMERETNSKEPVAVQVVPSATQTMASARGVVGPILAPIGTAAIVLVIAIFMMIGRDDLRDRVIHLVGRGRLRLTTHALDEAGRRVSRYLFAQLMVNVTYGIPVGIGLYFIGIPNAMLWGMLAIVLRFLPYIGPWIAAAFPVILSIAVSTSWTTFLLTLALFVVIELISNNVVEPWLYGAQTGLSPLAVVVSAVFWTWLWGLPGLVLATPLTVCLVVLGKYVPHLRWIDLLLGDRPPITSGDRLYHRLLAGDEEEALELVQAEAKLAESHVAALDRIALPAVRLIEKDFCDGLLLEAKRDEALLHLREIIAEMGDARGLPPGKKPGVLCVPASNLADEIAAEMLMEALHVEGLDVDCLSSNLTSGEAVAKAVDLEPSIVCVSAVSAQSVIAAAFMCKHLRARLPEARVMVGLWQAEGDDYTRRSTRLEKCGAQRVLPTVERLAAAIMEIIPSVKRPALQEAESEEEAVAPAEEPAA